MIQIPKLARIVGPISSTTAISYSEMKFFASYVLAEWGIRGSAPSDWRTVSGRRRRGRACAPGSRRDRRRGPQSRSDAATAADHPVKILYFKLLQLIRKL